MKRAVLYIIIVIASGIAACVISDYFLQRGFENCEDDVVGKLNEIIKDTTYYDVVCFGSSRALAHFNPQVIHDKLNLSAYNAGVNGACIIDINLLIKAYLHNRRPPKLIVFHVDDFTYETDRLSELPRYFPFINNKEVYNSLKPYNETVNYVHSVNFLRIMYYNDLLKWISIKTLLGIGARDEYKLVNGYRVNATQWNGLDEEGMNRRIEKINSLYVKTESEAAGEPLFMEVLEICKKKNIRLLFSSSPIVHGELNKLYEHTKTKIEKMSSGYNVSYLWMHAEEWDRKIYFYDYLHMNFNGANRYTEALAEKMKLTND